MNKYHKLVKSLRIEKGLYQEEISKKLDLSRYSYIAFEQGRTELSLSQASRIADIICISLEEMKSGLKPYY